MLIPTLLLIGGYAFWYFYYGFACAMNGATTWAHPIFMPLQCFWQELWWFLPGGMKRRADFVKYEVIGVRDDDSEPMSGVIMGSGEQSWHYSSVVRDRTYASCAKDILPGFKTFLIEHFIIPMLPLYIWLMYHFQGPIHAFLEYHHLNWR